jgi:hypothetical protein
VKTYLYAMTCTSTVAVVTMMQNYEAMGGNRNVVNTVNTLVTEVDTYIYSY